MIKESTESVVHQSKSVLLRLSDVKILGLKNLINEMKSSHLCKRNSWFEIKLRMSQTIGSLRLYILKNRNEKQWRTISCSRKYFFLKKAPSHANASYSLAPMVLLPPWLAPCSDRPSHGSLADSVYVPIHPPLWLAVTNPYNLVKAKL